MLRKCLRIRIRKGPRFSFLAIIWILIFLNSLLFSQSINAGKFNNLDEDLALIITQNNDIQSTNLTREFIFNEGGRVALIFSTHALIGWIPRELSNFLIGQAGIERIYYEPLPPDEIIYRDRQTLAAVNFFNAYSSKKLQMEIVAASEIKGEPLINDAFEAPLINYKEYLNNLPQNVLPSPGNSDTMTGPVAVTFFFIESDGTIDPNRYTWTDTAVNDTLNRASSGLLWWCNNASAEGYNLSFSIYYYPPNSNSMQQGYEPILHPRSDDYLWINAVMNKLGYTSGDKFTRVTAFNTWQRSFYGTNWAFSVFVCYNPSPAPTKFTDGYFAYAYKGGPYTQLLFINDGWGEANFGLVLSHETGHIFWACDEYYQAGYGGCTSCGPCSGLRPFVPNANCEYCNPNSVPCMMRYCENALCIYTKYQIGWLPSPSESSSVNNFTISPGGVYQVSFAVANSKTYTPTGYLSISVTSGLEIIEVDGLSINPDLQSSHSQSGVTYSNFPVGSTIYRCDSGTIVASYQLLEITAPYNKGQSRNFSVKFRAKIGASSSQLIKHRAAFLVPDGYYIRDPVSGSSTDQQNCYVRQIDVVVVIPITISTSPSGRQITVDGINYTAPYTFYWSPGSIHNIGVTSPQDGTSGTRYIFNYWSDGGVQYHNITTPGSATTYTAYFQTQYSLTTSVNPAGGGTVTPSGTNWYSSDLVVSIQATPAPNYYFLNWSGNLTGTQNPASITMNGPKTVTANFSLITPIESKLRLIVCSSSGNEIYLNSMTGTGIWEGWVLLSGKTSDTPSAATFNNLMHLIVKDAGNTNIWKNSWNGISWSGWILLDGQTPTSASMTVFNNRLYMAARGTDDFIYYRFMDSSGNWSTWNKMNGLTTHTPVITAFNNHLYMVVKSSTNTDIWWNSLDTSGIWSGWQKLDGKTPSAPSLAVSGNKLYLTVRGTDDFIYYRSMDSGGTWQSWIKLNGASSHSPATVAFNNRLYLVVKSLAGTQLWLNSMNESGSWAGWQALNGWTNNAPALVVY